MTIFFEIYEIWNIQNIEFYRIYIKNIPKNDENQNKIWDIFQKW